MKTYILLHGVQTVNELLAFLIHVPLQPGIRSGNIFILKTRCYFQFCEYARIRSFRWWWWWYFLFWESALCFPSAVQTFDKGEVGSCKLSPSEQLTAAERPLWGAAGGRLVVCGCIPDFLSCCFLPSLSSSLPKRVIWQKSFTCFSSLMWSAVFDQSGPA